MKPVDFSREKKVHASRTNEKIACFYARDYQIPDQPRINKMNNLPKEIKPPIRIAFKDDWDRNGFEEAEGRF